MIKNWPIRIKGKIKKNKFVLFILKAANDDLNANKVSRIVPIIPVSINISVNPSVAISSFHGTLIPAELNNA